MTTMPGNSASLLYIWQCADVCMFAVGARTVGAATLKFGTELRFHPRNVLANVQASHPHPPSGGDQSVVSEVHAARTRPFWENFINQNQKNSPELMRASQVRSGLGPHQGVRWPVQVQGEGLLLWSLGPSSVKLAGMVPTWGHSHRDVLDQLDPNPSGGVGPGVLLEVRAA